MRLGRILAAHLHDLLRERCDALGPFARGQQEGLTKAELGPLVPPRGGLTTSLGVPAARARCLLVESGRDPIAACRAAQWQPVIRPVAQHTGKPLGATQSAHWAWAVGGIQSEIS